MGPHESRSFGIEVHEETPSIADAPSIVVRLSGELDAHAASELDQVIDEIAARRPARIVVDVAEVSFIDSSGLRSLIRAHRAVLGGEQLRLRSPQPATLRLLDITGLSGQFVIV